jgi:hypothetical protein
VVTIVPLPEDSEHQVDFGRRFQSKGFLHLQSNG